MACASSCPTQAHGSYGECLRSKGLAVMGLESTNPSFTRVAQRRWDGELDAYSAARAEGLQPKTTSMRDVDAAKRAADAGV
jgi:hypothetical protein